MIMFLRPAICILAFFTLLTGFAYPYCVTGVAQTVFEHQANGSLVLRDGQVVGSSLIAQGFTAQQYFHARPSATTDSDPNDSSKTIASPYNATNSSGSNYGPTSKALIDRVRADSAALRAENPEAPIPVDLVTTSASGLDPHISIASAEFQIGRVAKARALPAEQLHDLIRHHTTSRVLGIFGEPVVNVLELNLALDRLSPLPK